MSEVGGPKFRGTKYEVRGVRYAFARGGVRDANEMFRAGGSTLL